MVGQETAKSDAGDRSTFMRTLFARMEVDREAVLITVEDGETVERTHAAVYADVSRAGAAIARELGRHGREGGLEGTRAAVVMGPPGYGWLLAALAVLRSGVRLVAVPETFTPEDAAASLAAVPFDLCLIDRAFASYPIFSGLPSVAMDDLKRADDAPPSGVRPVRPEAAAFDLVAFTSGSSSEIVKAFDLHPEGTEFFAATFPDLYGLKRGDRWAMCSPFSHIVHFEYALACLYRGLDIVLCRPLDVILNAAALRPSVLIAVPAVYEQLCRFLEARVLAAPGRRDAFDSLVASAGQGDDAEALIRAGRDAFPEAWALSGRHLKVVIIGAAPSTLALKKRLMAFGLPIFEAYGMSEVGMISANVPGRNRLGTIGPLFPGIDAVIERDGRLRVRPAFSRATSYVNLPGVESTATFEGDGWIATGDIVDEHDGYLRIRGRAKNLLILDRGKKVNPGPIESQLEEPACIRHAVLLGDGRSHVVALIVPEPGMRDGVAREVARVNGTLQSFERILCYALVDEVPDEGNGLLTRSAKLRRPAFVARHSEVVEDLYRR